MLKVAAHELAFPITNLINLSVEASCFPNNLKKSELSPLFKAKEGRKLSTSKHIASHILSIWKSF